MLFASREVYIVLVPPGTDMFPDWKLTRPTEFSTEEQVGRAVGDYVLGSEYQNIYKSVSQFSTDEDEANKVNELGALVLLAGLCVFTGYSRDKASGLVLHWFHTATLALWERVLRAKGSTESEMEIMIRFVTIFVYAKSKATHMEKTHKQDSGKGLASVPECTHREFRFATRGEAVAHAPCNTCVGLEERCYVCKLSLIHI